VRLLATAAAAALTVSALTAQETRGRSGDEAAVRETVQRYMDARNAGDARAIGTLFTSDADQQTTSGQWRRGRAEILPGTLDSSQRNPGTRTIAVQSVRFVTPDVAIADGRYEIASGAGSARTMWTTLVLTREQSGWQIAAIRNMVPAGSGQQ
jgi:uncharacterized protein (TIGR02246 family)